MKSELTENCTQKTLDFPCLMKGINTGVVVLMIAHGKGTIVHIPEKYHDFSTESWKVGHYSEEWQMYNMELYTGTVSLSN